MAIFSNKNQGQKKLIIVGGGTAGAIIARRLSNYFNVHVFEQSKISHIFWFYRIPLLIGLLFRSGNKFVKKTSLRINDVRCAPYFVSKVLGGASAMNGCVHVMGSTTKWKYLLDRFGINLDALMESYNEIFSSKRIGKKIKLRKPRKSALDNAFIDALSFFGFPLGDVEWSDSLNAGNILNTAGRFFRTSVMSLRPFDDSQVHLGQNVQRLLVNSYGKVVGIMSNGVIHFADIVIVSAGVMGTNKLLSTDAINFKDGSYYDMSLPVGNGLKDHPNIRVNIYSNVRINSLNEIYSSRWEKLKLISKHVLGFSSLMSGTGATSALYLDTDKDGVADVRIQLLNFSESGRLGSNGELFQSSDPGFSLSIILINPASNGYYDKDNDEVVPNYLYTASDVEKLVCALRFSVELLQTYPLSRFVSKVENIKEINADPYSYVRNNIYSGYHLIGGAGEIINHDFRIPELGNVFVCDASILSEYVSSNIHSTVVLLADLFSKRIIEKFS